jgi:hypothetical protein
VRQARTAELGAQIDELGRYAKELRQREDREWHEAYDRRQAAMEQLRALADEPLPHVSRSYAEHQAELAALDRYVDAAQQAEQDELRQHIDRCESRRLVDPAYRRRFDFHHPGGGNACQCRGHRAWRREPL